MCLSKEYMAKSHCSTVADIAIDGNTALQVPKIEMTGAMHKYQSLSKHGIKRMFGVKRCGVLSTEVIGNRIIMRRGKSRFVGALPGARNKFSTKKQQTGVAGITKKELQKLQKEFATIGKSIAKIDVIFNGEPTDSCASSPSVATPPIFNTLLQVDRMREVVKEVVCKLFGGNDEWKCNAAHYNLCDILVMLYFVFIDKNILIDDTKAYFFDFLDSIKIDDYEMPKRRTFYHYFTKGTYKILCDNVSLGKSNNIITLLKDGTRERSIIVACNKIWLTCTQSRYFAEIRANKSNYDLWITY